jgi:hypothetical protein
VLRAGGHEHRLVWLDDCALFVKPDFRSTFDYLEHYLCRVNVKGGPRVRDHRIGRRYTVGANDASVAPTGRVILSPARLATTNPTHVSDVMNQERYDEMQPVVRGHTANTDMPAAQNFLPNKRNQMMV